MKVFNVVDFLVYVEENDDIYFNESYGEIKKIVKDNGDGIYCLEFGSRGEVEFKKVDNFVEDIIEFNKVSNEENEFRWINEGVDDYLDLSFEEELFICYFIIVEDK